MEQLGFSSQNNEKSSEIQKDDIKCIDFTDLLKGCM